MLTEIRVPKTTQTYADVLYTLGLADLMAIVGLEDIEPRQVGIKDVGDSYVVAVNRPLNPDLVKNKPVIPGYPYLILKSGSTNAPVGGELVDYEHEKMIEQVYKKYLESSGKSKKGKKTDVNLEQEAEPPKPRSDLQVLKTFNSMRMGSDIYNKLHNAIRKESQMGYVIWRRLSMLSEEKSEEPVTEDFKEPEELLSLATSLQLFNPIAGKGIHRPKPDGTGLGSFPKLWVDWFSEWMKIRAMHIGMSSYRVGDDTKIMVMTPGDIPLHEIKALRRELLKERLYGSIKLEIGASLFLAEMLVKHSEEYDKGTGTVQLRNRRPNQVLKGVYTAYFKNLGNASAVMNLSFLGLPGWLPVASKEDAEALIEILEEHRLCLSAPDESHSDEVFLLAQYRDFLSGGKLDDLLVFLADFGPFVMQRIDKKKWVKRFTIPNLRRLLMAYDAEDKEIKLQEIFDNQGFLNLATAIRKATVSAQFRKAQGTDAFNIHYSLAQEWKRKVKFKNELVVKISDFVQQYNEENARHAEQDKERRKNITTEDLNQVFQLIDSKGHELVGMLLLAYGYAREPREEQEPGSKDIIKEGF